MPRRPPVFTSRGSGRGAEASKRSLATLAMRVGAASPRLVASALHPYPSEQGGQGHSAAPAPGRLTCLAASSGTTALRPAPAGEAEAGSHHPTMRTLVSIDMALRDARRQLARLTPYSREWLTVRDLVELLEQRRAEVAGGLLEA